MSRTKISLSWSGGKDCAYALYALQKSVRYEVVGLHATLGEKTRRISMHGIHESLVEAQAASLGLPLEKIYLPESGDNLAYEKALGKYLEKLKEMGVFHIAYGDILLEDLKKYREEKLAEKGFTGIFPLWGKNTHTLSRQFIQSGFKTKVCAGDQRKIKKDWIGSEYSPDFLNELGPDTDPCGENGEFHTFSYAGPIFKFPLNVYCKEKVQQSYDIINEKGVNEKKYYWFAELELNPWPKNCTYSPTMPGGGV